MHSALTMSAVLRWFYRARGLLSEAPKPRRYRVAPRQHPILFRRRLMQGIARELSKTELVVSRPPMSYSDTAL